MCCEEMVRGIFITFEGCEGAGKSTQIRLLCEYLDELGVEYIVTREPGGSLVAEQIRKIILDGKNTSMCDECEALLYAAARVQHLKEIVAPALSQGKLVICDRFVHSSLAYQGHARGLGMQYIRSINDFAIKNYSPDLVLFLDISPKSAFERKHGADKNDRMEMLGMDFHMKVYEGYKQLLATDPNIYRVDCSGTKYQTNENIINILETMGVI